ncbi:MAG TPA: hypothetical protein DDY98_09080, partial [Ruminococcaceae bacterium]|nr:hypothetical protein [Oscillospiraceae bacterium]
DSIYQTAGNKTLYAHYGDTYYDVGYDNLFLIDKWNEGVKGETERGTTVYNSTNKSIALTSNSGSTDSYTSLDEGKYAMPVVGGQTYVFTAEVTVSATATLRPLARALDDSNTSKQVKELGQVSLSPGSTYIYHKEWTVPSDATKVAIRFGTTTGGVTVTYKNIRFVKKSVADQKVAYPTNTDTYLDGTTYVNLAKPTRVGYVFDGWYSDVNCTAGNEIDENDVALDHITVYSKWLKLNEVTYDNLFSISEYAASDSVNLNEISGTAQVDGEKGSVTVPGNPVSGGNSPYTSWNTSSGYYTIPVTGGTKYYLSFYVNTWGGNVFVNFDNGTATDTNMTKCSGTTYIGGVLDGTQAKKYTFYFKAPSGATKIGLRFGASATESRTYSDIKLIDAAHYYSDALYDSNFSYVAAGTAYGELQTPTRKGYRFDGWFDNTACTGNPITSTSVIGADNVKLYSKWIEAYDVMYNTIFDFDVWGAGQVKTGATYSTAVDFGRNSYTITANSNHEGEVTSSANGPSVYRMPVVAGHKYKVSADITTDSRNSGVVNYNFLVFEWPQSYSNSWNDYLSPISEKTFSVDSSVTQNCSFVFTAKSDTDTISLRLALKSDGASKGTFSDIRIQDITATPYPESFVQVNAATTDSLSVQPEREGYHAAGWYDTVSADGVVSGTQYTSVASLNGNKTLYPKYSQKIYNVTYISAIGTQQKVQSMVYGANPTTAYIPSVVGYRFIGWYSDPQRITYAPQTVTGPLTLYAKWELITCNIGFDNIFLLKAQNIADYENVDGNTVIESRKVDKNNGTITMTYQKSGDDSERNLTSKLIDLPSEAGDNTYYIVSADVATTDCQARIMTFFYDKDGNNCDIWHTNDSSHPVVEKDGMPNNIDGPIYDSGTNAHHYYVVKVPKGCQKIQLRFDCLNVDATKKRTAVFSNIRVVEKTANTYATIAANYRTLEGTVTYSKAYNLTTVTNPGYVFEGWYMDASCTVPVTASNCTMTSNHTLYSKWEMNTLDITYDNLFDIRAFTSNDAHLSVDGQVITVNANKTESDAYQIPVKGGEQYKLSYEQLASTSENSGYVFVKFHKADGTVIDADLCRRYSAEECTNYPHSNFAELSTDTGAAPGDWSIPNYNEKENVVAIIKCDGLSQATPYNWTISGIVASKRIVFNKVTNADIGADSQTNTFGAVDIRFYTPSETAYITLDFGSESTEGVSFRNIELQRLETYTVKDAVRTLAITTDAGHAKQQTGYTCSGWKMDGAESNITSGTYDLSAYENGVRLASQWNVNTYRIAYAGMDGATHGSNHPVSATYGTAFAVSAPIKTGYRFKGWTVTSGLDASGARWGATASPETVLSSASTLCINGADDVYFLNLNDADDATVTLTANWEPNTATVHVKLDGVVWTNCNKQQIQLYQNGSHKYTIYPTEDKSVFVGSGIAVGTYDIYAGSGIGGYMDSGVTVTVDAASGAGTAEINYYTLTVKAGTGVSAVSGSGVYLCGIAAPVSATAKTGFDTPSFDAAVSNGKYTVTETKTITASASEISYNVSFVNAKADNDQMPTASSWPDASVSYHINSDAVIPSASANGYTFGGWKVVSESAGSWTKGDTIAAGTALKGKQGDVTLSPIWTAKTDVAYKVEHYVMNTLGIYPTTPTATDDLKGTTDAALTLSTLTKNNFLVANGIEYKEGKVGGIVVTATTVAGDGSRVIKLYYERVAYTLTVSASNVSGAAVKVNGSDFTSGSKVRYGAEITMGTLSANAGYHNPQWSGLTAGINGKYYMPASDVTLTAQASVNEIYSVEQGTVVDTAKQFIYGVKVGDNDISRYISATEGFSYLANLANKRFATGDTVTVQHNDTTVCEYTVVVFGDVNGDGWYDGTDAMLVNFIVNGMLTRDKLGEAVWTAADCNHDGEINQADADLLEQAGLLLSQVNQTIPTEEITSNSIYQEYLELIDQSPATIEEEHSADESGEAAETEETSWITILWGFITRLFDYLKLIFLILK